MTRRPTGAQAAAILASLSINAALLLGLRQVGNLPGGDPFDDRDASPLLVVELEARARSRSRTERRTKSPSRPAHAHADPRASQAPASVPTPTAGKAGEAPLQVVAGDDRWALPRQGGTRAGAQPGGFRSTFQHAMDDAVPPPARRPVLANLAFQDRSFGGLLARLSKMTDCGELQAALANHPGSARTILQTMQRLDCRP